MTTLVLVTYFIESEYSVTSAYQITIPYPIYSNVVIYSRFKFILDFRLLNRPYGEIIFSKAT